MEKVIRCGIFTFESGFSKKNISITPVYLPDAVVVIKDGKIHAVGPSEAILPTLLPGQEIQHYYNSVLIPGFIDCHVHYPQTQMIAAFGEQLLDWLNNYTFVVEQSFTDIDHARLVANVFLQEQLRNGVTSSCVFGSVHPESIDALFEAAQRHNMRLIAGKVCMDRHAPDALLDSPRQAYDQSLQLIKKWHGKGRLEYAITPRFAPTSSPEQLECLQSLAQAYPDMPIQSHISENLQEIAWVKSLFPSCPDYASVYDHYGLLRPRAIYGHGLHLAESEWQLLHDRGASLAHCPTSNFFLGSGCFNLQQAWDSARPVTVGLATDLGAGTSFSMLQTMGAAYKAAQCHHRPLPAAEAFYMATLGSAQALGIDDKVGSIEVGKEADLVLLDLQSTPLIRFRMDYAKDMDEALFIQMMLGDDRAIRATYVAGELVYQREMV